MTEIKPYMCSCCNDIWSRENQKNIKLGKYELHLCPDCYHEYIISNNKVLEQIRAEIEQSFDGYLVVDKDIDYASNTFKGQSAITINHVFEIIDKYIQGEG